MAAPCIPGFIPFGWDLQITRSVDLPQRPLGGILPLPVKPFSLHRKDESLFYAPGRHIPPAGELQKYPFPQAGRDSTSRGDSIALYPAKVVYSHRGITDDSCCW